MNDDPFSLPPVKCCPASDGGFLECDQISDAFLRLKYLLLHQKRYFEKDVVDFPAEAGRAETIDGKAFRDMSVHTGHDGTPIPALPGTAARENRTSPIFAATPRHDPAPDASC
ncbi:MAG: hypothetical protein AAF982_11340 [Pseudomonadota bacterium]